MSITANTTEIVKEAINSKTIRNTAITTIGTILNAFLAAIFFILVARTLGPKDFGIFSVITTIAVMLSDVLDLGTSQGIVRFYPAAISNNLKERGESILKLSFFYKVVAAALIIAIAFIASPQISVFLYKSESYSSLIVLSLVGSAGLLFSNFSLALLQALQEFTKMIFISFVQAISKPVILIMFMLFMTIRTDLAIMIFILSPILAFIVSSYFIHWSFVKTKIEKESIVTLFNFNKWVAIAFILAAVHSRLDVIMLTKLTDTYWTGIYSAAAKLGFILPSITGALAAVFSPKFSSCKSKEEAFSYFKKTYFIVGPIAISVILLILFAGPITTFIFGTKYILAILPFQILLSGMIFFVLSAPTISALLYFLGNSKMYACISIIQLITILSLNLVILPVYKAEGAAFVNSISYFTVFLISLVVVVRKLK